MLHVSSPFHYTVTSALTSLNVCSYLMTHVIQCRYLGPAAQYLSYLYCYSCFYFNSYLSWWVLDSNLACTCVSFSLPMLLRHLSHPTGIKIVYLFYLDAITMTPDKVVGDEPHHGCVVCKLSSAATTSLSLRTTQPWWVFIFSFLYCLILPHI